MFYEKRISSYAALKKEVLTLDSDAGIRIVGSYLKRPCFVFVTRFAGKYTVMVCERKGSRAPTVGREVIFKEFGSLKELEEFLHGVARHKVNAFVY